MKTPTDWPLPMTPDERIKFRAMLLKHKAALLIFADDLKHLVFEADQSNDHFFDKALETLLRKLQVFSEAEESEVFGHLKKEARDQSPPRAKRTYGHVVPSKKEQVRRQSGGGHTPHVTSHPQGSIHRAGDTAPWFEDDDDIPF